MRAAEVPQENIFVMKTLSDFFPAKCLLRQIRDILNGYSRPCALRYPDDTTTISPAHAK